LCVLQTSVGQSKPTVQRTPHRRAALLESGEDSCVSAFCECVASPSTCTRCAPNRGCCLSTSSILCRLALDVRPFSTISLLGGRLKHHSNGGGRYLTIHAAPVATAHSSPPSAGAATQLQCAGRTVIGPFRTELSADRSVSPGSIQCPAGPVRSEQGGATSPGCVYRVC
jgi:hypothetical protein